MKTVFSKKVWGAFLALALVITAVFGNVPTAKAATEEPSVLLEESGSAQAGVETQQYSFSVDKECRVDFGVMVPSPVNVTVNIYKAGTTYANYNIPANDPYWDNSYDVYDNGVVYTLSAGDYSVSLTFNSATEYFIYVDSYNATPKISNTKVTITKGFTKKLSVENGTVKSWSSSKKSVATVDKKGKVTAKKKGTATIIATLSDGTKLKCTVTVKDNKYSASKLTLSDVTYNTWAGRAYNASFDKNGNLVVKVSIVNSGYGRMVKISNFKVTVKNQNGKTVGTYKKGSYTLNIPSNSQKTYTITIKKSSKLSSSKVDLRNSQIKVDGGSASVRY